MKSEKRKVKSDGRKGFTIIELLVATGLFLVMLAVVTGAFVRGLAAQQSTLKLLAANDNAAFALEYMAREMRVGSDFSLANLSELHFFNSAGEEVTYRLADERIEKRVGAAGVFSPLTSNAVRVQSLRFILTGERKDDNLQPRLTIALAVTAMGREVGGVVTAVQTTVTPRLLDMP